MAKYGKLMALCDSRSAVRAACRLIDAASEADVIFVRAYTLDHESVVASLREAKGKGRRVFVLLDGEMHKSKRTRDQQPAVMQLVALGVAVRYGKGECLDVLYGSGYSGKFGSQHAKVVFSGKHMVLGSTNWTKAGCMSQDVSAVVEMSDVQTKWAEHNFLRDWDEALGASEAAVPQGDMRRSARNNPGHYGVERWGSSAEEAPYGHVSCVGPHVPKADASDEWDEVGTPWGRDEGRDHGSRMQERSQGSTVQYGRREEASPLLRLR